MIDRYSASYFGFVEKPTQKIFNSVTCQPGFLTYGCHCKHCIEYRAKELERLRK